jgi:hypothetical protein
LEDLQMTEPISPISSSLPVLFHARAAETAQHAQAPTATKAAAPPSAELAGDLRKITTSMGEFSARIFGPEAGGPAAMFAAVERATLNSITPHDFVAMSLRFADMNTQLSMTMMKFHASSSLGSAATGLFNTLLKNRE